MQIYFIKRPNSIIYPHQTCTAKPAPEATETNTKHAFNSKLEKITTNLFLPCPSAPKKAEHVRVVDGAGNSCVPCPTTGDRRMTNGENRDRFPRRGRTSVGRRGKGGGWRRFAWGGSCARSIGRFCGSGFAFVRSDVVDSGVVFGKFWWFVSQKRMWRK